ncbi:aspartyl/glutamyl-tRNA(Asn/Gln) amidotransferase subunit C [Thermocrinis minervae]|uniref:Aspartyl/glutamyl-tRNA(Asn/Gln) amidotransferase subunit C n=2 Tax=Thermocrinis minervae TaxID=381751 RepID=A0A1M6T0M2_9AQUI|nr:Asp-tRNA(Asn)/Glu-tRNA(Gln) amidotransferase subunit GatC [Thermocrinis minervae]SHK50457.1 aspartyl/glutamyl-tRNA(Asn/Gln) amidotransferase subunit C [Thermocrinis minervae]
MVDKIAYLARLKLGEEEKNILEEQFAKILAFVDQLKEVDTKDVEPYGIDLEGTPMRDDVPVKGLTQEEALMNGPQVEQGFFVVPRIVEV